MASQRSLLVLVGLLCGVAAGCGDGPQAGHDGAPPPDPVDPIEPIEPIHVEAEAGCAPLQARHCLLPFPNDTFTIDDATTDSGRRLAFTTDQLPTNVGGDEVDPGDWNAADGFSPGSPILIHAPDVDLAASGAPSITDLAHSLRDDSATLILDAVSGERHPHWAELDERSESDDPLVILRPAKNLRHGARYIVAVRGLVDHEGQALPTSAAFAALRDGTPTTSDVVEDARGRITGLFDTLERHGLSRRDLWLAWDFTVASTASLAGRALAMRDDAFSHLGDEAPRFEVSRIQSAGSNVARRTSHYVYGTFEVPSYLTGTGEPGERLRLDENGVPVRSADQPAFEARFACIVPASTMEPDAPPARAVVYGHGLLGTRFEVVEAWDIVLMTSEHHMVYCGTDWVGMTFDDSLTIGTGLVHIGAFAPVPDRLQQSFVNIQFLARLMTHPDGFGSHEAFQNDDGLSILDETTAFYDGNSMGGILGGAATALSTEWTRGVLGVPGMNFSTLLDRSLAFEQFRALPLSAYPDPVDRQLAMSLIQMLWDRGEANGYANHIGDDALPGTPPHQVLLHVAFGDFQVADVSAVMEARSLGAAAPAPILAPGRSEIDYAFGLPEIEYPWPGSAIILWDSGVPSPPLGNVPPTGEGDPAGRHDPHSDPRYDEDVRLQKSEFLRLDGRVIDVCDGPCTADRYG